MSFKSMAMDEKLHIEMQTSASKTVITQPLIPSTKDRRCIIQLNYEYHMEGIVCCWPCDSKQKLQDVYSVRVNIQTHLSFKDIRTKLFNLLKKLQKKSFFTLPNNSQKLSFAFYKGSRYFYNFSDDDMLDLSQYDEIKVLYKPD